MDKIDGSLFDEAELGPAIKRTDQAAPIPTSLLRLRKAERSQVEFFEMSLDELIEPDHLVRSIWSSVCQVDLTPWTNEILVATGTVGRNHTDPKILLSLWIFATTQSVSSARQINRNCIDHLAYRWLCGGVSVNYHMIADFRSHGLKNLDQLMTHIVASLMNEGLVTLERVSQDGMRVRANAGSSSFRRAPTLKQCLEQAEKHIKELSEQTDAITDETQKKDSQIRAAEARAARIAAALAECEVIEKERVEQTNKKNGKRIRREVRASTTDVDARVMKFPNGGYQPGANVQFSTDNASGVIVGVVVTNSGSDSNQLPPMLDQLKDRYGKVPDEALVDGGYATTSTVESAHALGVIVYAPLKDEEKQIAAGKDPYAKKRGDTEAVEQWRIRMGKEESKKIYQERSSVAEWVNAGARNRGCYQMPVRGKDKWQCVALLQAITHNMLQAMKLRGKVCAAV